MPSILSSAVFIGIVSTILTLLASSSPFMMASTPASGSKPWADGPMKLVETPMYASKKRQESTASKGYIFVSGASHMALLHNSIFRGFNSIYLQAPHVLDADKADFVGYALTWFKFVKSHHDDEELNLFTKIEDLLDDRAIFEETHKEHESFMAGLGEFNNYLSTLPTPQALNATKLLAIMDSFHAPFETHFHNEIATILSLRDHPNAPAGDSPRSVEASDMLRAWGKKTVSKAGTTDVVPFFLLNTDLSDNFEEGLWSNWPPMPAPIKWGLINVAGWYYGGYWKFASCDAQGMPRELYALEGKNA
ncbi:hypothetical protein N0V93_001966 [Gnomoniopsis smithogilvyi]|uniref:Hemerythrin-like domain-containing protein n=1 Tax=Gnomoniopsis smithogilvyi TaxID=1191159 RepID=A0A9W9D375_9PEZI|nr:hypothetical protein N0V93_001966 [Gnomoniopsis smithogilvyi]